MKRSTDVFSCEDRHDKISYEEAEFQMEAVDLLTCSPAVSTGTNTRTGV